MGKIAIFDREISRVCLLCWNGDGMLEWAVVTREICVECWNDPSGKGLLIYRVAQDCSGMEADTYREGNKSRWKSSS